MQIIRIFSEFGLLGWVELFAALAVAIGCIGELWIFTNKLTRHIEPIAKSSGMFWRTLSLGDSMIRPIVVRLKVKGRKLPESKEELLERFFVMLVAIGVGVEFICLMFSLHEVAKLNHETALANRLASEANERTAILQSSNAVMAMRVEQLQATNLLLQAETARLQGEAILLKSDVQARFVKLESGHFSEFIKGKITGQCVIWYVPDDLEAYNFASILEWHLLDAGWNNIGGPEPIPADKVVALLKGAPQSSLRNMPLIRRATGSSMEITIVTAPGLTDSENPGTVIHDGLEHCGFGSFSIQADDTLPRNRVLVIIGPKPWSGRL